MASKPIADVTQDNLWKAMLTAMEFWANLDHESEVEGFRQAAFLLEGYMELPQRRAILQDLLAITQADGEIADGEIKTIETLAKLWGIEMA